MTLSKTLLLAVCLCTLSTVAQAATLTIIIDGPNTGNVSARRADGAPGGGLCFGSMPHPTSPCNIDFPNGTEVRVMANSPSSPGMIVTTTNDAAGCPAHSTCNFILDTNSSMTVVFSTANPSASIAVDLIGLGEISTDHNRCQNWELGFSGCPGANYVIGSHVVLTGQNVPGSLFLNFSDGTNDAGGCGSTPCEFFLNTNSAVTAHFAALTSVAVTPGAASVNIGQNQWFQATGTFDHNISLTRLLQAGTGFSWRQGLSMSGPRSSLAVGVINQRLYAVGGDAGAGPVGTLARYDPSTSPLGGIDVWNTTPPATPLDPLPTARKGLAVAVLGDELYALGGQTTGDVASDAVESYNPGSNTWTPRSPLPLARTGLAAAVIGTTLYAVGGGEPGAPSNTLEAYASGSWTTLSSPMPSARTGLAAAVAGGKLYAIGGYNGTTNVGTIEMFDPGTLLWTTKSPMPTPRTSLEAVTIDGLIYAVGGTGTSGTLDIVEAYNPATDSWTTLRSMSTARSQFGLGALDRRVWAVGGFDGGGAALATLEAFRPPETTWWSGASAVATIDANGTATGLSAGETSIIARAVGIDCAPCATLTVSAPPSSFPSFSGGGQSAEVNEFLSYDGISASRTTASGGEVTFTIFYGSTIHAASFHAVFDGTDVTAFLNPAPGTSETIEIDELPAGRHVLILSVQGNTSSGRTATDRDRLTFVVP